MLPRRYRVPGYRIKSVLGGNTVFFSPELLVKSASNGLKISRLSIVVSSKFLAKATDRNRLRRQLVAMVDPQKITPGFDIVALIRKAHVR